MLATSEITHLLQRAEDGHLDGIGVTPSPIKFAPNQIGPASLDVRLGRWFLALHQSRRSELDLAVSDNRGLEASDGRYYYVPFRETFVVHPGRFVLASTLEWLRLPSEVGAYITGKSLLGRRGLIIETAAGIHPGFSGCLTLEISNCGEVPIAITPGMRIAQVFFHRVQGEAKIHESGFAGTRKPMFGKYSLDIQELEGEPQMPGLGE